MESTHHRADRNIKDFGDLFVVESLHVGEQNRETKCFGQRIKGRLDLSVGKVVDNEIFGRAACRRRLEPAELAVEKQFFAFSQCFLLRPTLLGPVHVDVSVRQDPKQPGFEVGARFETAESSIRLEHRLLHQVLGVGPIVGHSERPRVQRWQMLHRQLLEVRLVCHGRNPTPPAG